MTSFTIQDSQTMSAIPAGEYEIKIIEAYDDRGPQEGVSEKDGIPYYIHNRLFKAQISERISEDDDGSWAAFLNFNRPDSTFVFDISVGEKFFNGEVNDIIDSIPEENETRREMVRRNAKDAVAKASQIVRCHEAVEAGADFFEIINEMVGEKYNVTLSNYTRKNDTRTYYNVQFNSVAD